MEINLQNTKKIFKILMLHGYRQNEKLFSERTGSIRKILRNHAEFVYCEAPHSIPKEVNESESIENSPVQNEKGWWLKTTDWPVINSTHFERNFETTLEFINHIFETKG